jgi:hypothetical protein
MSHTFTRRTRGPGRHGHLAGGRIPPEYHIWTSMIQRCCTLAGWVHDLCGALGVPAKVANTSAEAQKFWHLKRKIDRDDAKRLAEREVCSH